MKTLLFILILFFSLQLHSQNQNFGISMIDWKATKINDTTFKAIDDIPVNCRYDMRFILNERNGNDTTLIYSYKNITDTVVIQANDYYNLDLSFSENDTLAYTDTIFNKQQILKINGINYYFMYNLVPVEFRFIETHNKKKCHFVTINDKDTTLYNLFTNIPYSAIPHYSMGVYEYEVNFDTLTNVLSWTKYAYDNDPFNFFYNTQYHYPASILLCRIESMNNSGQITIRECNGLIFFNELFQSWKQEEINEKLLAYYKSQNQNFEVGIIEKFGTKINDTIFMAADNIPVNCRYPIRFTINELNGVDTFFTYSFQNKIDTIYIKANEEYYLDIKFSDNDNLAYSDTIFNKQQILTINQKKYYYKYNLVPVEFIISEVLNKKGSSFYTYHNKDTTFYKFSCNIPSYAYDYPANDNNVYIRTPKLDTINNKIIWEKMPYSGFPNDFYIELSLKYFQPAIILEISMESVNIEYDYTKYEMNLLIFNNKLYQNWKQDEIDIELLEYFKNN